LMPYVVVLIAVEVLLLVQEFGFCHRRH
jgi:hypothetical protein